MACKFHLLAFPVGRAVERVSAFVAKPMQGIAHHGFTVFAGMDVPSKFQGGLAGQIPACLTCDGPTVFKDEGPLTVACRSVTDLVGN